MPADLTANSGEIGAYALVLLGLSSLAIAQPLLDVLGRSAEFFVASRVKPLDIVLLVAFLCLIIPGILFGIELLLGILSRRLRSMAHLLFVGLLSIIIALPFVKRLGRLPLLVVLLTAAFVGVETGLSYLRYRPFRQFLTFVAVGALVVPANFIFNTEAVRIVFPRKTAVEDFKIAARTPIVMVIFDELPLTSLLTERIQIDAVRYPNFAAFSKEAYWFLNTTCVSSATLQAVPSILSGSYPKGELMPTLSDYPRNLFTMLGGSYEMHVFEAGTHLCPDPNRDSIQSSPGFFERVLKALGDMAIVYGHIVLPEAWAASLPSVTDKWNDFGEEKRGPNVAGAETFRPQDRRAAFADFINSIKPSDRPALYFSHIEIPHGPFQFLPSGKIFARNLFVKEGVNWGYWQTDPAPAFYQYQGHLLQVGFTDKLLGDLLAKLKECGLFDPALVIVMSDHGISFIPGDRQRHVSETNVQDILPVPLFIKLPYQREGIVSERIVETIDVLPTIVDLLDISLPWAMDGRSVFDAAQPAKDIKVGGAEGLVFSNRLGKILESVKRRTRLFGGECAWDRLFSALSYKNLMGQRFEEFLAEGGPAVRLDLDNKDDYDVIDPQSDFIPLRIRGKLFPKDGRRGPISLAIAVNDTIRAVTETFLWRLRKHWILALLPENSFRPGSNSLQIFIVTGPENEPRLQPVQLHRGQS